MSALEELIYDRTQTDVTYAAELNRKLGRGEALTAQEFADWNAGLKGAYNAADMNRVDAAVRELGGMLTAAGYPVEYVDPRPDTPSGVAEVALTSESFQHGNIIAPSPEPEPSNEWKIGGIINYDTWGIYLKNVQNMREAYYTMPDTPELPMLTAPLKFDGANAIEKLLYDIQVLYDAMLATYRKCGTFQSGANVQQLPLQRSVT